MVDEFLSEEEQAEALKQWFKENILWIIAGVAIAVAGLVGWQRYQDYKANRAVSAAQLLEQFATAQPGDKTKADSALKDLTTEYAATPYADQAHLLAAQRAVDSNDFTQAATELRTVMDAAHDLQLRSIARLRLARVLIQQQKQDEALQLLNIDKAGAFIAQTHEVRGDALFSKGDNSGARSEYQNALEAYKSDPAANVNLLQLKFDDLNTSATLADNKTITK